MDKGADQAADKAAAPDKMQPKAHEPGALAASGKLPEFKDSKYGKELESESNINLTTVGLATAGAAGLLFLATRGRSAASETAAMAKAGVLPEVEVGTKLAGVESASLLKQRGFADVATDGFLKHGSATAQKILDIVRRKAGSTEAVEATAEVSDEMRRSVFNRFLSRLDADKYVVHGSYPLEMSGYTVRKATKDLDLLSLDKAIASGSKQQRDSALLADLKQMASKDMGDGLQFDVQLSAREPLSRIFPRMRHGEAIASENGREVLRIPLDIRVGGGTILPPKPLVLDASGRLGQPAVPGKDIIVNMMQPEETYAHKAVSYALRSFGGTNRKPKDVIDMGAMVAKGLDEDLVVQALRAWPEKGIKLGVMRHPQEILGARLDNPALLAGRTRAQLDDSYSVAKNYYDRVAPRAVTAPGPEVDMGIAARVQRFFKSKLLVYPNG